MLLGLYLQSPNIQLVKAVTFKDLKKIVSLEISQQFSLSDRLHNKPFWIWNVEEHRQEDKRTKGDCCFNYIITAIVLLNLIENA
jgi:hypothetical protein